MHAWHIQLAIISQAQDNKTNIQPDGFGRQSVSIDWFCKLRRGTEIFFILGLNGVANFI
jgi:hypothetical protein